MQKQRLKLFSELDSEQLTLKSPKRKGNGDKMIDHDKNELNKFKTLIDEKYQIILNSINGYSEFKKLNENDRKKILYDISEGLKQQALMIVLECPLKNKENINTANNYFNETLTKIKNI